MNALELIPITSTSDIIMDLLSFHPHRHTASGRKQFFRVEIDLLLSMYLHASCGVDV